MSETSRRVFLKSSMTAAVGIACGAVRLTASSAALSLKKGLVYSMLPEKLSHAERFKLAHDVGFVVVQAPTTPDEREAEAMKKAAA